MLRPASLILLVPSMLAGQSAGLDEGRLDPAWFGPAAVFQPSKALGLQWLKPGLVLHHRALRLKAWEPAAWLLGQRATKDQLLLERMQGILVPELAKGLQRGLKGALPVSLAEGDVLLIGRVVDAVGDVDDGSSFGSTSLSFDLRLMDGDTGELLGAFHDTLKGTNADILSLHYARWCEHLGRLLAPLATTSTNPVSATKPVLAPPPVPAFDLEGALRRIEGLRRDGLLGEEEYLLLRKKAVERGK